MATEHPATVLALGAWLKNTACLLTPGGWRFSELHGDLRDPDACRALEASARALVAAHGAPPQAIAHDLHPDFHSTRLAHRLAAEWGVPAIGVQHHHAHVAAVMAEAGLRAPVIGLALDGVGLGSDGTAWGGELLHVSPAGFDRRGHLWPLALPGGDAAAREPWRMLASVLHALDRGDEIVPRVRDVAGESAARMVQTLLQRGLNCPPTTSAGRWFDAASAALGLAPRVQQEAEAAIALERAATAHAGALPPCDDLATDAAVLDLRPLLATLIDAPARTPAGCTQAAALFHATLARALADWAAHHARATGCDTVCLSGGCFFNALLVQGVTQQLAAHGLRVLRPQSHSCGDAGLSLGQAWVAARQNRIPPMSHANGRTHTTAEENLTCA